MIDLVIRIQKVVDQSYNIHFTKNSPDGKVPHQDEIDMAEAFADFIQRAAKIDMKELNEKITPMPLVDGEGRKDG